MILLPNTLITRNISWKETWSSRRYPGFTRRRVVEPGEQYVENVIKTAIEAQKIRDMLNKTYGYDNAIGVRDKNKEIMLFNNSFWRAYEFQYWLYKTKKSTTKKGQHPLGLAIDLPTIIGISPWDFYEFIKYKCNTNFSWFRVYGWGVHCDRR